MHQKDRLDGVGRSTPFPKLKYFYVDMDSVGKPYGKLYYHCEEWNISLKMLKYFEFHTCIAFQTGVEYIESCSVVLQIFCVDVLLFPE